MRERILEVLRGELNLDVPGVETDLLATGLLDSLALVDLLARLEQLTGVRIPLDRLELDDFRTVDRIAGMLGRVKDGAS